MYRYILILETRKTTPPKGEKDMMSINGQVEGIAIAKYRKGQFTLTCKKSNGFYCITFHNGRKTNITKYTKDKDEANNYILKEIKAGYKRVL